MNYIILLVFCSPLSISSPFSWFSCCSDTVIIIFVCFPFLFLSFLRVFVCVCAYVRAQQLSCVRLFVTPWTAVYQAPLSMEFSRQKYWSGLYFTPPSDLLDPGTETASLVSPALADGFFTTALSYFFGFTRSFRIILYISCHSLQISYLSNEHWFYLKTRVFETKIWLLGVNSLF